MCREAGEEEIHWEEDLRGTPFQKNEFAKLHSYS